MDKQFLNEFKAPPSEYRGKPFWAWNGRLDQEELQRQIRIMKRMGLGGFFMHSRVGLDTPYLSKEWFDCVEACVNEAKKNKMEAWLYDEDRWPSGAAGGLVTRDKRFRARSLAMDCFKEGSGFKWKPEILLAVCGRREENQLIDLRILTRDARRVQLKPDESIWSFSVVVQGDSDWFNGQTYLDTLNPDAVAKFIQVTHEAYRKRFGKDFGKSIPGIFTDEPFYGNMIDWNKEQPERLTIPWTDRLPQVFKKKYGYDIRSHLPELFFDIRGAKNYTARYHYHDCVTFLFVESFAKQIGRWCEKNNILFTGHVLEEDSLQRQTHVVGSAMRFYEYMQAPGMDLLTERWRIYDTAKQVTSMARQFGRKWRLTETYGCTGWDFPFAGHKALGDWQVALGINLRCQHLSWYTMQGEAKRDYPAGIFYQSPWWEHYGKVEDYFGRVLSVMTRGEEVRDLLVIHPVESAWLLCRAGWNDDEKLKSIERDMVALRDTLLSAQIDFDYGEEEVLSRHGVVRRVKGKAVLVVNRARYTTVLVPRMETIRSSTLGLLEAFSSAGGTVVFAGSPPTRVDGVISATPEKLAERCKRAALHGQGLADSVECARRIRISTDEGKGVTPVLYLLREDATAFYLFLTNTALSESQMSMPPFSQVLARDRITSFEKLTVTGFEGCAGAPVEMDTETGEVFMADADLKKNIWHIRTALPALGSRLFVIPKKEGLFVCARQRKQTVRSVEKLQQKSWAVRLSECNNLVLDRPAYKIGQAEWQAADEILRVDRRVREMLKIKMRGGAMVQPWAREIPAKPKAIGVRLSYDFLVESLPSGDLFLGLEQPEGYEISLNEHLVDVNTECGWWTDKSLRKIRLAPAHLKLGKNNLTLSLSYAETFSGLEIIYLLGSFSGKVVGTSVIMGAPVSTLKLGDWTEQGLPFYSGSILFETTWNNTAKQGESVFLAVPQYRGVAVRILVNHIPAGIIAWEPNELDITRFLVKGSNHLGVEVIGHRRNSHGPHHLKEQWPAWTGPGQFNAEGDSWNDGYTLVPCGLMVEPEIIIKY